MKKQAVLLMICGSLLCISCRKDTASGQRNTIYVSDVARLYAVVNDTSNAGALIILSPGTYVLEGSQPNGGRIELLKNMALQGQVDHPEQVIIDETALPTSSIGISPLRTGGIRMGRGFNSVEWLTVKGNVNGQSAIDTDLLSTETQVRIAHVLITGSYIAIDVRNRLAEHAGRVIEANIEYCETMGNTAGAGSGIVLQNVNGATGSIIKATLKNNYMHGNRVGFRAFNNGATTTLNNSRITATLDGNRIEENGLGLYVSAGLSQSSTALASGNYLSLSFSNSTIKNNNPSPMPAELKPVETTVPLCGIYAISGISTVAENKTSDNRFELSFSDCDISNNHGTDIYAYGGLSFAAMPAGTNNFLQVKLEGISKSATVNAIASLPAEAAGTNVVNVIR